jgi:hypothetical protein
MKETDLPVTGHVDLDQFLDSLRGKLEYREVVSDSSVVDEDAWGAELLSDLDSGSIDSFKIGHVAFDVVRSHY